MRTSAARTRTRAVVAGLVIAVATVGCASRGAAPRAEPAAPSEDEMVPVDDASRVSVGYGTSARRDVTSAISSVTACDIDATRVTRVEDLLQGRVAGVVVSRNRAGATVVQVRGANSLYGGDEPLFVLDGMPLFSGSGALVGISPQDVARIDVLKDAGATAIYGSRGANGVIVITTRRGGPGGTARQSCD